MILTVLGYTFVSVGVLFLFLGALGIFRMPDIYNRLQAGTKATTLGALGTILGIGFLQPEWFWKTLLIAVFIAISNPVSSHALARASYKAGLKPQLDEDAPDDYANVKDEEVEE